MKSFTLGLKRRIAQIISAKKNLICSRNLLSFMLVALFINVGINDIFGQRTKELRGNAIVKQHVIKAIVKSSDLEKMNIDPATIQFKFKDNQVLAFAVNQDILNLKSIDANFKIGIFYSAEVEKGNIISPKCDQITLDKFSESRPRKGAQPTQKMWNIKIGGWDISIADRTPIGSPGCYGFAGTNSNGGFFSGVYCP